MQVISLRAGAAREAVVQLLCPGPKTRPHTRGFLSHLAEGPRPGGQPSPECCVGLQRPRPSQAVASSGRLEGGYFLPSASLPRGAIYCRNLFVPSVSLSRGFCMLLSRFYRHSRSVYLQRIGRLHNAQGSVTLFGTFLSFRFFLPPLHPPASSPDSASSPGAVGQAQAQSGSCFESPLDLRETAGSDRLK